MMLENMKTSRDLAPHFYEVLTNQGFQQNRLVRSMIEGREVHSFISKILMFNVDFYDVCCIYLNVNDF